MMSEKFELIGDYPESYGIPKTLTASAIPTVSELDYVGSEDFEATMIEKILPAAISPKIDFNNLYDFDFYWVCRIVRFLNYGPYFTTNAIYCPDCGTTSRGEYSVDLRSVECKVPPKGVEATLIVKKDEFFDYDKDVVLKFVTIKDVLTYQKDPMFSSKNSNFARLCYSIKEMGGQQVNPVEAKIEIEDKMSPADYAILKNRAGELLDYGLRLGGSTQCPECGKHNASFMALVDDRFLRPTMGDLKQWKADRDRRKDEDRAGSEAAAVRKHS